VLCDSNLKLSASSRAADYSNLGLIYCEIQGTLYLRRGMPAEAEARYGQFNQREHKAKLVGGLLEPGW
jgi:hypothetical protein